MSLHSLGTDITPKSEPNKARMVGGLVVIAGIAAGLWYAKIWLAGRALRASGVFGKVA